MSNTNTEENGAPMTTIKRYLKRPVTIEAAQLTGDTAQWHAIYLWVESNTLGSFEPLDVIEGRKPWPPSGVSIDPRDGRLIISTLEGLHWANEGDWIIRGVQGEFYPCKDAIFRETYEAEAAERMQPEQAGPTDAEVWAAAEESEYHEQWGYDESGFPHCECGASLVESEHDLSVVPSLMAHQAREALVAARKVSGR